LRYAKAAPFRAAGAAAANPVPATFADRREGPQF